MCGRYVLDLEHGAVVGGVELSADIKSYNVAPTHTVPILVDHWVGESLAEPAYERRLHAARWGLIPTWAQDASFGSRAFNARSETIFQKPTFRTAAISGHCAVPMTGYYEWKTETLASGKLQKTPYFVRSQSGEPLYMAGLYEWWKVSEAEAENPRSAYYRQAGTWVLSCSVVTMSSAEPLDLTKLPAGLDSTAALEVALLHDRLPVPLSTGTLSLWLRSGQAAGAPSQNRGARQEAEEALDFIRDQAYAQTAGWKMTPAHRDVGRVQCNEPYLLKPEEDLLSGLE